jgi:uncharacterized protein YggL (DUF469 family)
MNQRNPHSRRRLSNMSPRQRKKLRVGEFAELGFTLEATLTEGLTVQAEDALLDAWLNQVDALGVSFGGSFTGGQPSVLTGMVFPVNATKVDETMRQELVAWLNARPEVARLAASELGDVWYGR